MKEEKSLPTLGEFIIEKQRDFKYSTGNYHDLLVGCRLLQKWLIVPLIRQVLLMFWEL